MGLDLATAGFEVGGEAFEGAFHLGFVVEIVDPAAPAAHEVVMVAAELLRQLVAGELLTEADAADKTG